MTPKQEETQISEELRRKLEETEEKLNKAQQEEARFNKKLKILIKFAELSRHDIRNKLHTVQMSVDVIGQRTASQLSMLTEKVGGALQQIEEILDTWKGFEELFVPEKLKYTELIDTFLEAFYSQDPGKTKGVTIEIDPPCQDIVVWAALPTKIFYNLIDNSLRHGKKVSNIKLICEKTEEEIVLKYQDNGIGIPEENKEQIFEDGFSSSGGTGRGLFLTREICRLFGGDIKETGKSGKGAEFTITLGKLGEVENFGLI